MRLAASTSAFSALRGSVLARVVSGVWRDVYKRKEGRGGAGGGGEETGRVRGGGGVPPRQQVNALTTTTPQHAPARVTHERHCFPGGNVKREVL